ncbi:MAG: 50S ribosomal protein L22 [Acidimicrobiales bacterium]
MPGVKTNEREGTRSVLRHSRMSATKARQVLDLIRGQDVDRAADILALGDREAATVIGKVLHAAVANAVHNDGLDAEELYVSACYADEGSTLKRWRPRARGRATRIRKRSCHITVIVSRLPEERIARRRAAKAAVGAQRSRRVAGSRRRQRSQENLPAEQATGNRASRRGKAPADEPVTAVEPELEPGPATSADEDAIAEADPGATAEATADDTEGTSDSGAEADPGDTAEATAGDTEGTSDSGAEADASDTVEEKGE